MASSTKVKINYDLGDNKTASRTISNINPEATSENLAATAEKFNSMQKRTVKSVERIDTTVISG